MFKKIWKYRKPLILLLTVSSVFFIYKTAGDDRIRYVALGDSLAAGQNPYGEINYGYVDYVANYLNKNHLLKEFIKDFTMSGARTKDIINDINGGKTKRINQKEINLKYALREANLVTVSIGANDFLEKLTSQGYSSTPSLDDLKDLVDTIFIDIEQTLSLIRQFAKGQVIVIGYYNPFPNQYLDHAKEIDTLFAYIKDKYQQVCAKYKIDYVDIYECIKKDASYLPNPFDIHPNAKGYEAIANEIIRFLES